MTAAKSQSRADRRPWETDWTPSKTRALTALWNEGIPTREIGRRFGVTHCAVIGKAHRLGLPRRLNRIPPKKIHPPRRGLADLGPDQCRFPSGHVGDEDFRFCGAVISPGKSYCEPHHQLCHIRVKSIGATP